MARLPGREAIYEAAERWKRDCLINDGSIFSQETVWTRDHCEELVLEFVDKPDLSDRSFEIKLKEQLAAVSPGAKRLVAEMLWLMFLFRAKMGQERKVAQVSTVWAWSGRPLPGNHKMLSGPMENGIGSPGTAFNTGIWRELAFVIVLSRDFKELPPKQRQSYAASPWQMSEWLSGVDGGDRRQMRHILLHLLFPDLFERIAAGNARIRVYDAYAYLISGREDSVATSSDPATALDQKLLAIRATLEEKAGGDYVDFYQEPYRSTWNPSSSAAPTEDEDVEEVYPPATTTKRRVSDTARPRVWAIGAGEGAAQWPIFQAQGRIAIGWEDLGDLRQFETQDSLQEAIKRIYDRQQQPWNDSLACFQFCHQMAVGDEVFVKQGRSRVLGYGRIVGEYEYDATVPDYRNVRRVEWLSVGNWPLTDAATLPTKTLTDVTTLAAFNDQMELARKAARFTPLPTAEPTRYTIDDVMNDAFLARDAAERVLVSLRRRRNLILQGSPGVGKSFLARRLAYALIGAKQPDQVQVVQFHQSFAYEDFIQGWRPTSNGGFALRNGVFYDFCRRAQGKPGQPHVFVIDEINRGNLSKVFGELLLLIEADKRGPDFAIPLTYSESATDTFFVPENVYLVGLMNTADRSLAMVDYALRRRFAFVTLEPAFESPVFRKTLLEKGVDAGIIERIIARVGEVNRRIVDDKKNLGAGFAIGHSYFCPPEMVSDSMAWYDAVVADEIRPLLQEYWFDDEKLVEQCMKTLQG
jgi:hypothetical protein